MGKQKGERAKNRPSSSSLAASLLPSGGSAIGFGGYLGSSRIEPPSLSEESTSFSDVDGEVAQHLKRLGRKDPTTKLKALASLCLLFKQKAGEELAQIVPQWAFEYKKLLLDYNREVRRATHDAMTSLAATVRKGLVPHLKSLMGPWWFSQFDPIPEVSQAAKRSFEAAFPSSERRLDALMLCISDIFLYLDENLKLTPQAMSDKATPMDELEDMHQRVISSSLLAIATLVDILLGMKCQSNKSETINTEQKLTSTARAATLASAERMFLVHNFYLEFFQSKSPVVRSAAYSVQTSLIKHIPHVYSENNMKTISAAILGIFQEKDASCHSSMWDMVLLFSRKFPDCWSHNNIQKVVLSRLWNFLRHGCYGSPQISYPALVVFLESVPLMSVGGEQFIINFFQNMWAGRNPLHSSTADSLAFFKALKECFLWGLNNASRYNMCVDATDPLPGKLVCNILVSLLWRDYHSYVNLKTKDESLSQRSSSAAEEGIEISDARTTSYPISYVEELGKCIVEILSDISAKEFDLLTIFSTKFHKDCLETFQQGEHQPNFPLRVERISSFFRLLYQFVWLKGQTWPLNYLAGPLFASSFRIAKSMDSPDAVRFLYVLVELFGPVTLFSYLRICNESQSGINSADDTTNETKANFFLQSFRDDFVPWCLNRHTRSRSEKVDLLIASVEDGFFAEQWSSIITYATNAEKVSETGTGTLDVVQTEVLAILIEKVKEKINKMKTKSVYKIGCLPDHWQHELLDASAVSVALHPSSCKFDARFLRAVLGGSLEDDKSCFLSEAAVISVFQEILKKLVIFISTSSLGWARFSSSLVLSRFVALEQIQHSSFADRVKMCEFAFEIIEGSIFCSKILGEDCMVFSCILAAIFIIDWECGMLSCMSEGVSGSSKYISTDNSLAASENVLDDHSQEQLDLKLTLGRRIHDFRHKISASIWRCVGYKTLSTVRSILVQTVRSAAIETNKLASDRISSLCCEWMLDMLEVTCHDQAELQSVLDQILMDDDSWPMWVAPSFVDGRRSAKIQDKIVNIGIKEVRHNQFIAFVEKLCSSLGFSKMIGGFTPQTPVSSAVTLTEHVSSFSSSYSRAWLAVELLCTWKWQGGSALDSFLPSLSRYAKCELSYPEVNVIFSIVNILLDGAIFQGANSLWISLNTWVASDDEVENIRDPFLRALTSLLLTLFVKDKVWRKHEALELFENVVGRLSMDTAVKRTTLRILPFILSILIEPLLLQSTEFDEASKDILLAPWNNDSVLKNLLSWLQKALSFPPLGFGQSEPDLDEWIPLIISCYPLRATGIPGTCKVDVVRDICHLEKPLLLSLFQKQRCGNDVTTAISEMSSAASTTQELVSFSPSQMALGKLTALSVGYCWKEFSEDDWDFVFDSVKRWIESSVLLMEELTEKIDEIVMSYTSISYLELVEKLKLVVLALDPTAVNISGSALLVLSLFSQLAELQEADSSEVLQSIKLEKWPKIKDQIMENILRLFLATGVAEAIASSSSDEASSIVASSRMAYSQFWGQVASFVISSPHRIRNAAVKSMELWGLSKGPINALYAILFSSKPIPSLQFAAYWLLSTEPLCHLSLLKENILVGITTTTEDTNLNNFDSSSESSICLMDEISSLIQKPASMIFEMDLASQDRVNVYLAWAILLSYLHSLSPSSSARERLIQYIQESVSSAILDCIFQNIPLKHGLNNIKKKDADLVAEASIAASAAKHVISSGSVFLSLETLWPLGTKQMASLAGSIYGMMIWLLPSYVRNWFTSLRDRAHVAAIESFTKLWCSPSLLSNELSQVKETVATDENFSVSVNKSAYEIIATYNKEETGMDLVIRLPNCYPLRPVDVDCTRSLGISEVKKRKWLLSLTAFIRNQNGAVGEAIRTWKNNLDKEFLGVEECPICYSIIHTTNHSLPRLACKTCKHKFHSACLYKWFSTSHKSTCPLCQTPF